MNKQIGLVTLLMGTAVISAAYEFNDPVFNQILADELEDLEASLDEPLRHPRVRRDEEAGRSDKCRPSFGKKKLCCAEETLHELHEKGKEEKKECFRQVVGKDGEKRDEYDPFRCDKMEKHKKEMTCVVQCLGQKKEILNEDGSPEESKFGDFVKQSMAKEPWFASIQDKVIQTCLAEARNATSNRDTSDRESCNPAGVKLVHCLLREIQLGCPAEEIRDQKACSRLREKIRRHNNFLPPPPPFSTDE